MCVSRGEKSNSDFKLSSRCLYLLSHFFSPYNPIFVRTGNKEIIEKFGVRFHLSTYFP